MGRVTADAARTGAPAIAQGGEGSPIDSSSAGDGSRLKDQHRRSRKAWRRRRQQLNRRGLPGQLRQRTRERDARRELLTRAQALRELGMDAHEIGELLGLPPRTQRRWAALERAEELLPKPLGRPAARGTPEERAAALLDLAARPRTGVPALRQLHPELGRRELEELSARFRSLRTTRRRDVIQALTWDVPGAVWATDFSDAGLEVEGSFPHLLLVRDLATGYELLALPCRGEDVETVRAALTALLLKEGPPLVLKADNGGGFVAAVVADLLERHEVLLLRSPPRTPSYNGSREAAGGSIKTRAHHLAAAHGREACWSCEDVEAARVEANEAPRAQGRGAARGTPGERWRARGPLDPALRQALGENVRRRVEADLAERGLGPAAQVEERLLQRVARGAIAGALRELGLLSSHLTSIPARRGPRRTDERVGSPGEVHSST